MKLFPVLILSLCLLNGCYYLKPHATLYEASNYSYWKGQSKDSSIHYAFYIAETSGMWYKGTFIVSKADTAYYYGLKGTSKGNLHNTAVYNGRKYIGHISIWKYDAVGDSIVVKNNADELKYLPNKFTLYRYNKKPSKKKK